MEIVIWKKIALEYICILHLFCFKTVCIYYQKHNSQYCCFQIASFTINYSKWNKATAQKSMLSMLGCDYEENKIKKWKRREVEIQLPIGYDLVS